MINFDGRTFDKVIGLNLQNGVFMPILRNIWRV